MVAPDLVIFDCDGVLVDSEPIAIGVLSRFLAGLGVDVGEDYAYRAFLGRTWPTVVAAISREFGLKLTDAEAAAMRAVLFDRFRAELKPVAGVGDMLDSLGIPCCVASSSMPDRLRLALEVTGLLARFEPHVFSASAVARGKPAPDLFLHAAAAMGADPRRCLVVEDSPPGIEAARAAGMAVIAFLGGGHVAASRLGEAIAAAGPDAVAADMADLAALLAARSGRRGPRRVAR